MTAQRSSRGEVQQGSLHQVAASVVAETQRLVQRARTEEDLRIGFEKILEPSLRKLGVEVEPRYEKWSVFTGTRADAVHGRVIIEYERPRSFSGRSRITHAYQQLVDQIRGEAKPAGGELFVFDPRFVGVGFDGQQIFFVRYTGDKTQAKSELREEDFVQLGPYPFSIESARTLLAHMRALCRRPLCAEQLTEVFGPQGDVAPAVVSALVDALENWPDAPRVQAFYDEWRRLFGIVYGEQLTRRQAERAKRLRELYGVQTETGFQQLLFCVHTYFVLLMKLIATELVSIAETSYMSSFCDDLVHSQEGKLRAELEEVETGGAFAKRGIRNFLEGDFFRWYLDAWSPQLRDAIVTMARGLAEFEPATPRIEPGYHRDVIKKLYQYLLPQEIRHDLGEYYTPDWLAELVLNEVGYNGQLGKRVLDPACGSGTFLVLAIQRARARGEREGLPPVEVAKRVLSSIWGFDLNPLAVVAARTNYLFAMGELIETVADREIPVYLADSVLWPQRASAIGLRFPTDEQVTVPTSAGEFHVPTIWVREEGFAMRRAAPLVEEMARARYAPEEALKRLKRKGLAPHPHEVVVETFYKEVLELEKQRKNGIWARFLKNAFAPMIAGQFDFVVGNPPWIRWGYLSRDYRDATYHLWKEYGLFSLSGSQARLGGGEKDFSMLFTYAAVDAYLPMRGKLGFLITQEVFKSKGAGEGFRRFRLGDRKPPFRVMQAHDLVQVQPFEGASNKTALIIIKKGEKHRYPVRYTVWERKKGVGRIPTDASLAEAKPSLRRRRLSARPIGKPTGSWVTFSPSQEKLLKIEGENAYRARRGASTSPYGVYWLELQEMLSPRLLIVRNMRERGKREVPNVEEPIESELVFPALSGAEVHRWGSAPTHYVLLAQDPATSEPYPESEMKQRWPRTYGYLTKFKDVLLSRGSNTIRQLAERTAFYAMFGIGPYTVERYKVVWKRMASDIVACVVSQFKAPFGYRTVIPTDTTALFAAKKEAEAHYLCAVINSKPVRDFIKTFSSAGRGFGAPSVMQHVAIPQFDAENPLHTKLAELSQALHALRWQAELSDMPRLERQVDSAASKLFGI